MKTPRKFLPREPERAGWWLLSFQKPPGCAPGSRGMDELPTGAAGFAGRVCGRHLEEWQGCKRMFCSPCGAGISVAPGLASPEPSWWAHVPCTGVVQGLSRRDAILKPVLLLGFALAAESLGGVSPPS